MKKLITFTFNLLIILFVVSCGSKSQDEATLVYDKFTLDNGLEVILHHDDSDPKVSVTILYHVGSNREKPGKTGFAHFFEHMLFQRSENVPRNAFFQKIDALGGSFNGMTWNDGTIYFETVPRDALEKVLWMESDRMGYFINTVTQGGLEREIDVVSNEKRQGENRPYGLAYDLLFKNAFPKGHPYSWTVIGEIADLRSATIDDVKEFYHNYYGPQNATLVIAGDFDPVQTREMIEKYFGEISGGVKPAPPAVQNITFDSVKLIYFEDRFANAPMFQMVYPSIEMYHEDGYALDFLTMLLSSDKKSPMYKVLVEEKKLTSGVDFWNWQLELAGLLMVNVTAFPDVKLDDVYAGVEEAFARFERDKFDEKDLQRYKTMMETQVYNQLVSIMGKAEALARGNVFAGKPDEVLRNLEKYRAVTKEDIWRVYNKYIKGQNYMILSTVPKGQAGLAVTGSVPAVVEQEKIEEQQMKSQAGEVIDDPYEKSPSRIDRSIEPPLMANTPELKVPAIWRSSLPNGMTLKGIEYTELPLINFSIELNSGMLLDQPSKPGVAYMTAQMLNEGTALKTPAELEEAIGQLGAYIRVGSSEENMNISANCLKKNFKQVMELVEEMIMQPRWDEKSLALVKERTLNYIRQNSTQPSYIANSNFKKLIFGKNSILSYDNIGTEESVNAITMEDIKEFYNSNITPSIARMNFVGGLDQKEVGRVLKPLTSNWKAKEAVQPVIAENAEKPEAKVYFIDYPGSTQSYIVTGNKSIAMNHPDAFPATIVNDKLGGSAGSILFDVLRLKRGYTYGAYSGFAQGNYLNYFRATSSVQATVTKESLELFREILTGYQNQFTQQYLDQTTNSMLMKMNGSFETPGALLGMLRTIAINNMPENYVKERENTLRTITLDQAKDIIGKYIDYDNMVIVVVGDAKSQLNNVKKANLGILILLDRNGEPVK